MSYLSNKEMEQLGFHAIGNNVKLSRKASFYNCANISIGNNVRIDDFCVLSAGIGGIQLGNFIHIGVGSTLIGQGNITMSNYSGLSSKVSIYSSSDDYSGQFMTNPTIPLELTNVEHSNVFLGKHVIIGSGSVILPGVNIFDGAAVAALSLIKKDCEAFGVYFGIPAKKIKERSKNILNLENQLNNNIIFD